jgi:hypothetical protein
MLYVIQMHADEPDEMEMFVTDSLDRAKRSVDRTMKGRGRKWEERTVGDTIFYSYPESHGYEFTIHAVPEERQITHVKNLEKLRYQTLAKKYG